MKRPFRHRGYVLVMTLLLLAIAAVTVSGLVAESQRRAMNAQSAEEELQHRWAVLSCQSALLPRAGNLLSAARAQSQTRLNRIQAPFHLGDDSFTVVICDEQAKANVNLLARYLDPPQLRETLEDLAGGHAAIALRPTVTRTQETGGGGSITQTFASYGQVFGRTPARELAWLGADRLTCWGDTRLNTRTAAPETISAVARTVLNREEFERFARLWDRSTADWHDAFRDGDILPDKVKIMESRVTESSNCYLLWIVPQGREPCQMAVSDGAGISVSEW